MREDVLDGDGLTAVMDERDQAVFVAADVEHGQITDEIGGPKRGFDWTTSIPQSH
jgi:hypothetical protein